jgi:thioredoxin-like negative regulator of GroEL
MPLPSVKTNLIEIEDVKYDNDKIDFVFFHNPDSELSEKMRFEVERLAQKNYENINFYSIDVSKNPVVFYEYNVSGIPNILVFNGEKEIKRIMGLVPYKNLLKIAQRIENEYGELQ